MTVWRAIPHHKTEGFTHRVTSGVAHALLSHLTAGALRVLGVSASIWSEGLWWSLHGVPNLIGFESEHGIATERQAYNDRSIAAARQGRVAIVGEHAGYSDYFVPLTLDGEAVAVLVVGPFAEERPNSAKLVERWRTLTGRQAHLSDPEFALYLSRVLSTLVLEGDNVQRLGRLLECFARLLSTEGKADELANEADRERVALEKVRHAERTWSAVDQMIDDRSPRIWASVHNGYGLDRLGLPHLGDHVLVGLCLSKEPGADPIDEAVRRDAFQRRSVELALSIGDAISGKVGDQGVVFLSAQSGSAQRKRQKLLDLSERARTLARREFGLTLHFGASAAPGILPLSRSYQAALAAAESALTEGERFIMAEPEMAPRSRALREQREVLRRSLGEDPGTLKTRFERYLGVVAAHSGYNPHAARVHLEVAFEMLADSLAQSGQLDAKGRTALDEMVDRAASSAHTLNELLAVYRRALDDLREATEHPVAARQNRSLRSAIDYIHQHYTEPLRFEGVARLSGFAPKYFSKLFKQRERRTFEEYVLGLRLERAKHLLSATDLDVGRVAKMSGFASEQYFCRAFRREVGRTALAYRRLRDFRTLGDRSQKETHHSSKKQRRPKVS